ncbi:MAG: hypothetical protein ACKN9T_05965 [Candidatus Methylumidiphilus sp.]
MKKHLALWVAFMYVLGVWGFVGPGLVSAKDDWRVVGGLALAASTFYVVYVCWRVYAKQR